MLNLQIKYAVLNFGYAEDTYLSSLIMYNKYEPFTSDKQALKVLAQDLLSICKEKECSYISPNECCVKSRKNKKNNYCSKCGSSIKNVNINAADFSAWLLSLLPLTLDYIGSSDVDLTWELGHSPSELLKVSDTEVI